MSYEIIQDFIYQKYSIEFIFIQVIKMYPKKLNIQ